MGEQGVERLFEILGAALAGGENHAVEDALLRVVVEGGEQLQPSKVIRRRGAELGEIGRGVGPTGEDLGHLGDDILIVGGDGQAGRVELEGAVGQKEIQTDGEELHDLAGVVFVGRGERAAGGVKGGLRIPERAEVNRHHRIEGDVFQQCAEITEGAVAQNIVVVRDCFDGEVAAVVGNDEDFTEREGDTLAQLVRSGDGVLPPRGLAVAGAIESIALAAEDSVITYRGCAMSGVREGQLGVDPSVVALGLDGGDFTAQGAKGGLGQESRGLGGGG